MLRPRTSALLLALALVAPAVLAVPATAAASEAAGAPVLAVEDDPEMEEEEVAPPGPEPQLGEDSPFGPAEYEIPWTYAMGVLLTAVAVLATIGFVAAYWFLVRRPERETSQR